MFSTEDFDRHAGVDAREYYLEVDPGPCVARVTEQQQPIAAD
jgi:hypothetical protein